jgi:ABC-type multidrug transport system ATPase subunit
MTVSEWAYSWTQSLGLDHIMDKLGLGMAMGKPLGKCSRGMRQKALIAPFLAEPPDVLILDEPISTMDPSAGAKTLQLIRECGCAALVSCHLGRLPRGVADTLHVIVDGTISYSCPAKDGVDVEKIYLERGI